LRRAVAAFFLGAALAVNARVAFAAAPTPAPQLPSTYRGESAPGAGSYGDLHWYQVFGDPVLQSLVDTALANNFDVLLAYQRVEQASAQLKVVGSQQSPQANLTIQAPLEQVNGKKPPTTPSGSFQPSAVLGVQYELDLFGALRNQTAAAAAQLLGAHWAQQTVYDTLVSGVVSEYFQLRELDEELSIARETVVARQANVALVRLRLEGGIATLQDLRQAQIALLQATSAIPVIEQDIGQTEDVISTLIGTYPSAIARGRILENQIYMPDVPQTGLPSQLLTRRPDVQQAEAQLVAANAQINVARAALLPQATIGGTAGFAQQVLNGIFYGPQGLYGAVATLVQRIFNGGGVKANVHVQQTVQKQAVLSYLQTVQRAMQEVSDALIAYKQQRDYRVQEALYTAASLDSVRLANLRWVGGVTSYLEVLDAETRAFTAQIALAQADLTERLALVSLYQSLGGAWQTGAAPAPGSSAIPGIYPGASLGPSPAPTAAPATSPQPTPAPVSIPSPPA
jgi:outer membrane protein, multidrug efflux system